MPGSSVAALATLAVLTVALVAVIFAGWRRGLSRRPVLLAGVLLAAALPLDAALVWARLVPEAYVRFGHPRLTVAGFFAMAFVALRLASVTGKRVGLRTTLSDLATTLAVLACALAATRPELGHPLDRMTVIALVDRSRSIELVPHAEQRILRELTVAEHGMREEDRIGRVVFGAEAQTEEFPRPKSSAASPQRLELARDATDIAAGLRRALADVPADSAARIALITDGVATRGDTLAAAAAAVGSEVPVDVIVLEQRELPDVRLVSLRAPPRAHEGETLRMRVVVSAPANAELELRLLRDGKLVRRIATKVASGETVVPIAERAMEAGLHRYDVEVTARDPALDHTPEDNVASVFVRVRGPARALVLDGDPGRTAFVAGALRGARFVVEEGDLAMMPADLGGFAGYDVIVFGDIAAPSLAPVQLDALASFVRDLGGGLVLLGGDRSFGPGGYSGTALEEVSPVSFDLKQEQRRASLAEVIAIDISGSMSMRVGAQTKLELANEAAARSASLLGAGDELGVLHVDTATTVTVPLAPLRDKPAVEKAIRLAGPGGGGIDCDVALRDAYAPLRKTRVNLKHVLLFADGADAENITPLVEAMVSDALKDGITTSCVALGQGSDVPALEQLSRLGGGRFYIVEDATRLPAVFTQETILASRSALVEEPFKVTRTSGHPVLAGVLVEASPPLGGYVVTVKKPRADVLLTGPENDPVLALWQAGLGHTAVFTSDLKDRWGGAWTGWDGAAKMVAQVARHVARREDDARVRLEAEILGGALAVRATAVDDDGSLTSFRRLTAVVRGPGGFAHEVALESSGAGTYEAKVPLKAPGAYVIVTRDELSAEAVATTGAVLGKGEEMRPTGSDHALLGRIAELTGGKRRDTLAGIFGDRPPRRFAYEDVTVSFALLAAAAMLLSVAARRLAMPEAWLAWLERRRRSRARHREGEHAREHDGTATLDALVLSKQANEAVRVPGPAAPTMPDQGVRGVVDVGVRRGEWSNASAERVVSDRGMRGDGATNLPAQRDVVERGARGDGMRKLSAAEILIAQRRGRK
ncbi:MAG: VWA domain-containing protein [Myxococcales bacterium]|nr:VWA domain-containing protein [Myxococcales bacterium]